MLTPNSLLPRVQYTSPFIGFDDMEWYVSGAMLTSNTFGAMVLPALALPLLDKVQRSLLAAFRLKRRFGGARRGGILLMEGNEKRGDIEESGGRGGENTLALSAAVFLTVRTLNTFTTVLCAAILRKNIVVWAIIAPKLVFELFFFVVTSLALTVGIVVSA